MTFTYTPLILALLISTAVMAGLALYVWRDSGRQAITPRFSNVLILASIWSFGFALEIAADSLDAKVFFSNIQFVAIALLPVAVISLAMKFTGRVRIYRIGMILGGGLLLRAATLQDLDALCDLNARIHGDRETGAPDDAVRVITRDLMSGGHPCTQASDFTVVQDTRTGQLVFGVGCGLLTWVIRSYGGYPDGVAFAILILNVAAPFIDAYTQPRVYGHAKGGKVGR